VDLVGYKLSHCLVVTYDIVGHCWGKCGSHGIQSVLSFRNTGGNVSIWWCSGFHWMQRYSDT
jgi:hypothetical protein